MEYYDRDDAKKNIVRDTQKNIFDLGREWFDQCEGQSRKYHKQYRKMNKFLSNKQVEDENDDKIHIQFNKLAPLMSAIKGTLINNQRDLAFKARAYDGSQNVNLAAEMVNNAATWMREVSRGERAEVFAFGDAIAAGIGYIEMGVDYTSHRKGHYIIKRVAPPVNIF